MGIYLGVAPKNLDAPHVIVRDKRTGEDRPYVTANPIAADKDGLPVHKRNGEPVWVPAQEEYASFYARYGKWQDVQIRKLQAHERAEKHNRKVKAARDPDGRLGEAEKESTARESALREVETVDHRAGWCVKCGNPLPTIGDVCSMCLRESLAQKDPWWLRAARWVMR